jgi:hypothetical protein
MHIITFSRTRSALIALLALSSALSSCTMGSGGKSEKVHVGAPLVEPIYDPDKEGYPAKLSLGADAGKNSDSVPCIDVKGEKRSAPVLRSIPSEVIAANRDVLVLFPKEDESASGNLPVSSASCGDVRPLYFEVKEWGKAADIEGVLRVEDRECVILENAEGKKLSLKEGQVDLTNQNGAKISARVLAKGTQDRDEACGGHLIGRLKSFVIH